MPVMEAEADEVAHFLPGVVRHIRLALPAFYQDELVSAHDDVVFVLQKNHAIFFGYDVRQVLTVTEGAGFLTQEAVRFLSADAGVEVDDVHGKPPFCILPMAKSNLHRNCVMTRLLPRRNANRYILPMAKSTYLRYNFSVTLYTIITPTRKFCHKQN